MQTTFISDISLFNFRNYKSMNFEFCDGINIIFGKNGIGKTNILEALSFLSQGKGLRSDNLENILLQKSYKNCVNKNSTNYDFPNILWSVFVKIQNSDFDNLSIYATICDDEKIKKLIKVDNENKSQTFLNTVFNVFWLTPNMNGFFNGSSAIRRKFLDKAVNIIDNEHLKRLNKYEFLIKERMKILIGEEKFDEKWVSVLEKEIAEIGIAIAVARNEIIDYLNKVFKEYYFYFPSLDISIKGYFEDLVKKEKSLKCEEKYIQLLKENRGIDAQIKKMRIGIHKSDIQIVYKDKNMFAELCSTGEQKLMLISLTLAKVIICNMLKKAKPILLLDEVCSHLDNSKKSELFKEIEKLKVQSFLTGVHKKLFNVKGHFLDLEKLCN
jgi:DNA replication and repair protein RecF